MVARSRAGNSVRGDKSQQNGIDHRRKRRTSGVILVARETTPRTPWPQPKFWGRKGGIT